MWRGERTMRGPQIRSLLSSLFGVLLVYISVFSIYFILDDITGFLLPFNSLLNISLPEIPSYTIFELVMALFILYIQTNPFLVIFISIIIYFAVLIALKTFTPEDYDLFRQVLNIKKE